MDRKFDEYFLVVCKEVGGIEPLLDTFFDFLRRRTDFFYEMDPGDKMGFQPGANVQMLLRSFKKQQDEHYKKFPKKDPAQYKEKYLKYAQAQSSKQKQVSQTQAKPAKKQQATKVQVETNATKPGEQKPKVPQPLPTPQSQKKSAEIVSSYNGGKTEKYTWSQQSRDIVVNIPLPSGTKSKQLDVKLESHHLKVMSKKTQQIIIEGDFYQRIRAGPNDSTWIVETNNGNTTLILNLEKADERIWSTILKGDNQIDTSKVQNTKALSDFDEQTQAAIEKLRYDQDQKMKGLPTSDELKQRQMLEQAWNAEGSPFKGTPFDPSKINMQGFNPQM